jgi:hypothetical protein
MGLTLTAGCCIEFCIELTKWNVSIIVRETSRGMDVIVQFRRLRNIDYKSVAKIREFFTVRVK